MRKTKQTQESFPLTHTNTYKHKKQRAQENSSKHTVLVGSKPNTLVYVKQFFLLVVSLPAVLPGEKERTFEATPPSDSHTHKHMFWGEGGAKGRSVYIESDAGESAADWT